MELNKRRSKKCFGVLFLCFIMSIVFSGVFSKNVSALWTGDYGVRTASYSDGSCVGDTYTENHTYSSWFTGCHIIGIVPISQNVTSDGDTVIYSGKLNLVKELSSNGAGGWNPFVEIGVRSIYFGNYELSLNQTASINKYITRWTTNYNGIETIRETLTITWTINGYNANINGQTGRLRMTFYVNNNSGYFDNFYPTTRNSYYYFENTNEPLKVIFVDTGSGANSTIINQNNITIGQNEQIINQNQQFYDNEYQGEENISNQTTDDIQGATNQQTTNIIGFIGNFLSALQNVQPSNCQLTLPFPNFAGGSRTVNICDGKQYAPGIVTIAGSLLLIITFVPLAFIILRMIYNEIRSWTNG